MILSLVRTIIVSLFVFSSVFAQNNEKRYFENNPALGGDVIIKSASVRVVSDEIFKTFEIESVEDGAYYLDAWMTAPDDNPEYKVDMLCGLLLANRLYRKK